MKIDRKIRVIKKKVTPIQKGAGKKIEVLRCGSRVSLITFNRNTNGKMVGSVAYHSNYSVPIIRDIREIPEEEV